MIELTPKQQQFVEAQVAAGGFKDPTEVVQAGIELLRKAAERDYSETVREIHETIPDLEAGRGRSIEEVDTALREKLGFTKSS
jgi:Arc/MetJ-type ribon-helix-helix transcriptional regulator